MPIPQNQILAVEILHNGIMSAAGSNPVNTTFVWHYRRITLAVPPNKANIKTEFSNGVLAATVNALNNTWTGTFIRIRFPNDPLDQYQDFADASAGAITGDRMSSEDSAYLSFKTALRGKSYRGGKHIAPMSESDSTTGSEDLFNAACLTRLAAINTAFLAGMTDADGNQWTAAVLSRNLSNFSVTPCVLVINDVTEAKVNKRIGSMLRRKVKSVY